MEFIETTIFTKLVCKLLPDDDYRMIQHSLLSRPEGGDIIKGSGGLRKIRWNLQGGGKRGGLRLIYYWDKPYDTIYMVFIYKKSKQEDLTPGQLKTLGNLVKELLQ